MPLAHRQLSETDRNGRLARPVAPLANWASRRGNSLTRPVMEGVAGIDRKAELPKFHGRTFTSRAKGAALELNRDAPAFGRKAVLYATCFVNYNNPGIGEAAREVLAKNGVDVEVAHPRCCGMPKLEHGDLESVAETARAVARDLAPYMEDGRRVIALIPSCALMLKFEWPLIVPDDEAVKQLSAATSDISEYMVDIARDEGLAPGLQPLAGGITLHLACHARAQNMGPKAADMLRLVPETEVSVIERCSGHGGSWGIMKDHFETALKVGKPAARQALEGAKAQLASECPLAGGHIAQGMERLHAEGAKGTVPGNTPHPIELMARAYGLMP